MLLLCATGCHRTRITPARVTAAAPLVRQHCWWTSLRTGLPPDSVGARFARAFTTMGFADVAPRAVVDTIVVDDSSHADESVAHAVVVHARATGLAGDSTTGSPAARYEGLAVAWVRNDTTRVRYYLARDPEMEGAESIGRCQALWRLAMAPPR